MAGRCRASLSPTVKRTRKWDLYPVDFQSFQHRKLRTQLNTGSGVLSLPHILLRLLSCVFLELCSPAEIFIVGHRCNITFLVGERIFKKEYTETGEMNFNIF